MKLECNPKCTHVPVDKTPYLRFGIWRVSRATASRAGQTVTSAETSAFIASSAGKAPILRNHRACCKVKFSLMAKSSAIDPLAKL
eukprot:UN3779